MGCTHPGCDRLVKAKGLCHAHYQQWQRCGETWEFGTNPHRGRKPCTFPGCGKARFARGLCQGHAAQARKSQELRALVGPRPDAAEGYSYCSTCHQFWPTDCFVWDFKRQQPQRVCKDCRAAAQRANNRKPSAIRTRRRWALRRNYGIEPDQYLALHERQRGRCAVCREPIPNLLEDLDIDMRQASGVDHCHATGRVRGLLCRGCNHGLGGFNDDVEKLRRAVDYLNTCNNDQHD